MATCPLAELMTVFGNLYDPPSLAKFLTVFDRVLDETGRRLKIRSTTAHDQEIRILFSNRRRIDYEYVRCESEEKFRQVLETSVAFLMSSDFSAKSEHLIRGQFPSKLPTYLSVASPILAFAPEYYPGARWYGNTKHGKFMSEAEARAHGYRPARNGQ